MFFLKCWPFYAAVEMYAPFSKIILAVFYIQILFTKTKYVKCLIDCLLFMLFKRHFDPKILLTRVEEQRLNEVWGNKLV